jgi:hypothetical protein
MFRKIALILFTFIVLISSLISFSTQAIDPVPVEVYPALTPECIDICPKTELQISYEIKPSSICSGNCPMTAPLKRTPLNNSQPSTIQMYSNQFHPVLLSIINLIIIISYFSSMGGLITTLFLSIKRKKFEIIPFFTFSAVVVLTFVLFFLFAITNQTLTD